MDQLFSLTLDWRSERRATTSALLFAKQKERLPVPWTRARGRSSNSHVHAMASIHQWQRYTCSRVTVSVTDSGSDSSHQGHEAGTSSSACPAYEALQNVSLSHRDVASCTSARTDGSAASVPV